MTDLIIDDVCLLVSLNNSKYTFFPHIHVFLCYREKIVSRTANNNSVVICFSNTFLAKLKQLRLAFGYNVLNGLSTYSRICYTVFRNRYLLKHVGIYEIDFVIFLYDRRMLVVKSRNVTFNQVQFYVVPALLFFLNISSESFMYPYI